MCGISTLEEENKIFENNYHMIKFLSKLGEKKDSLSFNNWNEIIKGKKDIVNYSVEKGYFNFRKKIATKSHHGKSKDFQKLVEKYSIGIASKDLPFGIIPKENRNEFGRELSDLYPSFDKNVIKSIKSSKYNLIICIIKGFKVRGDDNRPDRGLLPLISMFTKEKVDVLSYIYGPILETNYRLLNNNIKRLAAINGFWKVILSLNNFVIYDSKIINNKKAYDESELISTSDVKNNYTSSVKKGGLLGKVFSSKPREYHEDDVDTAIHYLFKHVLNNVCFEGMCNPPGGDWSGFSIIDEAQEKRWLSLPRVSEEVNGKRPDHIIQLHNVLNKPVLLSIESKENSSALEANIGKSLKNYIKALMEFTPSVEKNIESDKWSIGQNIADYNSFIVISAAAYLKKTAQKNDAVFNNSKCDMLIILDPLDNGWDISIITSTRESALLKKCLCNEIKKNRKGINLH